MQFSQRRKCQFSYTREFLCDFCCCCCCCCCRLVYFYSVCFFFRRVCATHTINITGNNAIYIICSSFVWYLLVRRHCVYFQSLPHFLYNEIDYLCNGYYCGRVLSRLFVLEFPYRSVKQTRIKLEIELVVLVWKCWKCRRDWNNVIDFR